MLEYAINQYSNNRLVWALRVTGWLTYVRTPLGITHPNAAAYFATAGFN